MAALEEVCKRLDHLAIAFFDTLNEIDASRKSYAAFCSEGYFGLTRARYAMGVGVVSSLQYDTTMTALARVSIREEMGDREGKDNFGCEERDESFSFDYHHPKHPVSQMSSRVEWLSIDNKEESSVRKRGTKPTSGVEEVKREDAKGKEGEWGTAQKEGPKDPLLWFGVLASHHLRTTQKSFIEGASLCCHLAGLQTKLMALKKEYQVLLLSKKSLLADLQNSESKLDKKEAAM